MRVLVTGGPGFLGSHSVKAIVDAGHEVRLLGPIGSAHRAGDGAHGLGELDHVSGKRAGGWPPPPESPRTSCRTARRRASVAAGGVGGRWVGAVRLRFVNGLRAGHHRLRVRFMVHQ
jgi:hypothetical protein